MDHLKNFVEKPHPDFGNLPICPFVKQARVKGKIQFVEVYAFGDKPDAHIEKLLRDFGQQNHYEAMLIIHPDKSCKAEVSYSLAAELQPLLVELKLLAFGGGPDDEMTFNGVHTRKEPYCNVVIQSQEVLAKARATLPHKYFKDGLLFGDTP